MAAQKDEYAQPVIQSIDPGFRPGHQGLYHATIRSFLQLALILLFAGCSGGGLSAVPAGSQTPDVTDITESPLTDCFPALPETRGVSSVTPSEINGCDTYGCSSNAVIDGQALDLLSGNNSLSWGPWHHNPVLLYSESIEVVIDAAPGDEVYAGMSDFAMGSWDFPGPLSAGTVLTCEEPGIARKTETSRLLS